MCVLRHVIDGHKMILLREDDKEQKVGLYPLHSSLVLLLLLLLFLYLFLIISLSFLFLQFSSSVFFSPFSPFPPFPLFSFSILFHASKLTSQCFSLISILKVEACTFEQYEVYAIDVAMTSGDGKPKEHASRTTVLKRLVDMKYGLKVRTR